MKLYSAAFPAYPPACLAATHTTRLINGADLAAPFELTRQTTHEHVTLLERVFLVERLPPWHVNQMSRLVKRFGAGVALYDGSATINFGGGLCAVPVRKLWEPA